MLVVNGELESMRLGEKGTSSVVISSENSCVWCRCSMWSCSNNYNEETCSKTQRIAVRMGTMWSEENVRQRIICSSFGTLITVSSSLIVIYYESISEQATRDGLLVGSVFDAGKTQVEQGSLTVVAIGQRIPQNCIQLLAN